MGPGRPGPGTKEEQAQRRADIWRMRCESMTQAEIAKQMGITQQRVSEILSEAAREITQQASEELRKVELDKLDKMEQVARAVVARHEEHDDPTLLAALDRMLKIGQRRAALVGLDAPQQVESRQYSYQVNGVSPEELR